MASIINSLARALGQFTDPAMLRILLKSVAITLISFILLAIGGWFAFDRILALAGVSDARFSGSAEMRGLVSLLLTFAGLWLGWRLIAMAVIQFFADDVVVLVEKRHYPTAAATARNVPLAEEIRSALKSTARALLVNLLALPFVILLLVTGVGSAILLWLVNGWLIGRELPEMVWLRHRSAPGIPSPISTMQATMLGLIIAGMLIVPFVSFLAPLLGAAAATHLLHRMKGPIDEV
ncbi:EI24 domain-containing protein [Altericroceibacterium endophyticum]|uniref:Uncharacterized protein n=1 Tax=Altericroceibacterium endophyticum TaxID=1808508 RepID=A0A6I4T6Q5_9SPHN|nr:EI24 domain-containing protein [Altericroceibacterium endophyticum]MXO65590.1 hypothetical protein [Altericroceibacterium endophyticum]